jgi:hypothetical protein
MSLATSLRQGPSAGDVIEQTTVKDEAMAGLRKYVVAFKTGYKYTDFWPVGDVPEELREAEPVKFTQIYADQMGSEMGYGNVHEGMDPDELGMVA